MVVRIRIYLCRCVQHDKRDDLVRRHGFRNLELFLFAVWIILFGKAFAQTASPALVPAPDLPNDHVFGADPLPPDLPDTMRRDGQGRVSMRCPHCHTPS
jgi:hypothetical protein